MLVVGTRSAELPRVAGGEMAAGDEYCDTKLLTFKKKFDPRMGGQWQTTPR
jgi:hypothetical protein